MARERKIPMRPTMLIHNLQATYEDEESSNEESDEERNAYALQIERFKSGFPKIPNDLFNALPDEVKEIMKLQHAYYLEKYKIPNKNLKPISKSNTFSPKKTKDQRRIQHATLLEDPVESQEDHSTTLTSIDDIVEQPSLCQESTHQQFITHGT